MIVPRICPDLDIKVAVSSVAFFVFRLFSEVPVRHMDSTSRCEELIHIVKDLCPFFESLEVVERCEKNDGIICSHFEGIEREHIADSETILRMESPSFFDHSCRIIDSQIPSHIPSSTFHLFKESPISTPDIEHTRIPLFINIRDDVVEFWPGMILT